MTTARTSPNGANCHECPEGDFCSQQPCCYSLSRDPDYRSDLRDRRLDPVFHHQLWTQFWFPSTRTTVRPEEAAAYAAKFDRCQRLENKRKQINMEVDANMSSFSRSLGIEDESEMVMSEAEFKLLKERCVQKIRTDFAAMRSRREPKGGKGVTMNE